MLRRKRRSHQRAEQRDSDACGAPSTLFVCVHYSLLHGLSDPKYGWRETGVSSPAHSRPKRETAAFLGGGIKAVLG